METLKYTVADSTLTIQKVYGQTGCDTTSIGNYTYKINGSELWLNLTSDNCDERAHVLAGLKLTRAQ